MAATIYIFEQIKQYVLESFQNILRADVGQAAQFYELSSLEEKKNIQSGYSQITDSWVHHRFLVYHFTSLQFIPSAAHNPFAQIPYFVFHGFPLETLTSAILQRHKYSVASC